MPVETTSYANIDITAPPFLDLLTIQVEPDLWILNRSIQQANTQAEAKYPELCLHDLPHTLRAANNGLVLHDMLISSPITQQVTQQISQNNIVLALQFHDIGYGEQALRLVDRHVLGHERASIRFLKKIGEKLPFSNPSRRYIEKERRMIDAGILGTEKNYERLLHETLQYPTLENIAQLIVKAADNADYFIRDRVAHLPKPVDMSNPYHTLAYAVSQYTLRFNPEKRTLTYAVNLHTNSPFTPTTWRTQVEKKENFPQVFALLRTIADLTGYRFVIDVTKFME